RDQLGQPGAGYSGIPSHQASLTIGDRIAAVAKMGDSPHALVPVASLRSCQQRSPVRRNEEAMSLRTKFFAMTYDRQIAGAEKAGLHAFRERLLADASGDVSEIGGGPGLNLSCYGSAVRSLPITEPQPPMLRR